MATTLPMHAPAGSPASARHDRGRRVAGTPVGAVVVLVVLGLIAFSGAWRLPAVLASHGADPSTLPVVTTSFGAVTVAGFELLDGPSPEELGGVTHGIGGYVDSEHALMRVHLQFSGADAVIPTAAFALELPDGSRVDPELTTVPTGILPTDALQDASLSFVLPRGSGDYALVVSDGSTTTNVPLGQVTAVPRPAAAHNH